MSYRRIISHQVGQDENTFSAEAFVTELYHRTFKKFIVAPDSFKGCLTSSEVAEAMSEGIRSVYPDSEIRCFKVADGGEGTLEAISESLGAVKVSCLVRDPLFRPTWATMSVAGTLAVMEMAEPCGLTLLSPSERNPMRTSTYGLGELILEALERGCREFLVGIGGSATNDAGMGMMAALGARFLDADGLSLSPVGGNLSKVSRIDLTGLDGRIKECSFTVACDVDTPFSGPTGAAYVFAPQKGADSKEVELLDKGLRNFGQILRDQLGKDLDGLKGGGAAGGLGGCFHSLLPSRLVKGIDMVLETAGFDAALKGASYVLTGEGCLDHQTASGKTASGVLDHARGSGAKVLAFGGLVRHCPELDEMGFDGIYPIHDKELPLEVAMDPQVSRRDIIASVIRALKEC